MPPFEHPPAPTFRTSPPPPPSAVASVKRVIEVAHLRKLCGSTVAVDDVSFDGFECEVYSVRLWPPSGRGEGDA